MFEYRLYLPDMNRFITDAYPTVKEALDTGKRLGRSCSVFSKDESGAVELVLDWSPDFGLFMAPM